MTMTAQQLFDKVAIHLLTQNGKSLSIIYGEDTPTCAYRGAGGRSCSIGCLIPDSLYTHEMEGKIIGQLLDCFPELIQFIPDRKLSIELQNIHDSFLPTEWKSELILAARRLNLDYSVVENFHQ